MLTKFSVENVCSRPYRAVVDREVFARFNSRRRRQFENRMWVLCYFISGDLYSGTKNILVQGVDISSFHVDLNVKMY
jgi:hypothetical protein